MKPTMSERPIPDILSTFDDDADEELEAEDVNIWVREHDLLELMRTLTAIAQNYPKDSKEYAALNVSALAYHYTKGHFGLEKLKKYMNEYGDELNEKEKACYKIMGYSLHGDDWDEQ